MNTNKIYVVGKPGLKLNLLRAELADNTINTSTSTDGIHEREVEEFLYSDISSINISLIDINQHRICIGFSSGKKLKLRNISFGELKDGKIRRATVNQTDKFNEWISELHKMLIDKKLVIAIDFTEGGNAKRWMFIFLICICIVGVIFGIFMGLIGPTLTLVSGIIFFATFLSKMGTKRYYDPESKILY